MDNDKCCGNCNFFEKSSYNNETYGFCEVELPPFMAVVYYDPDSTSRRVEANDKCSWFKEKGASNG